MHPLIKMIKIKQQKKNVKKVKNLVAKTKKVQKENLAQVMQKERKKLVAKTKKLMQLKLKQKQLKQNNLDLFIFIKAHLEYSKWAFIFYIIVKK